MRIIQFLVSFGLTGIANISRSRLSGLDDLLRAGTVPLMTHPYRVGAPPVGMLQSK